MSIVVRPATKDDLEVLLGFRCDLWPDGSAGEHREELEEILAGRLATTFPYEILVAESQEAGTVGYAEITLSSRADGCDPRRPVGYLEGIYVIPAQRRTGVARALFAAFEQWARERGCREVASDTWIDATESQRAHEAAGYEVVDRCVNYRKSL